MARISGVEIPDSKQISIGLTRIFGIGRVRAVRILEKAGIALEKRVSQLNDDEIAKIQKVIDQYTTEGALRKIISENIKRLKTISSYRGIRHERGLPVRGQRTRSNARTGRGKRRTIGAIKKKDITKTEGETRSKE